MNMEMYPGGVGKVDLASGICDLIEKACRSDGVACRLGKL